MPSFDLIGFDADDTLWHNESLYQETIERFIQMLSDYAPAGVVQERLDAIEARNLKYYGYGITGFTLSLIESAIDVSGGRIPSPDLLQLTQLSRQMIDAEVRLLERVEASLESLASRYSLLLITKGDLMHQHSKLERSGLSRFFDFVEVVSDKTTQIYAGVLERLAVKPDRFLMVGNSLRSDILPVLEMGGSAVYIPYELVWQHEMIENADLPKERFFELENIGQLDDLLKRLNSD